MTKYAAITEKVAQQPGMPSAQIAQNLMSGVPDFVDSMKSRMGDAGNQLSNWYNTSMQTPETQAAMKRALIGALISGGLVGAQRMSTREGRQSGVLSPALMAALMGGTVAAGAPMAARYFSGPQPEIPEEVVSKPQRVESALEKTAPKWIAPVAGTAGIAANTGMHSDLFRQMWDDTAVNRVARGGVGRRGNVMPPVTMARPGGRMKRMARMFEPRRLRVAAENLADAGHSANWGRIASRGRGAIAANIVMAAAAAGVPVYQYIKSRMKNQGSVQ